VRFETPAVVSKTSEGVPVVGVICIVIGVAPVTVGFHEQEALNGETAVVEILMQPAILLPLAKKVTLALRSTVPVKVEATPFA
jgi:hypothetical protein